MKILIIEDNPTNMKFASDLLIIKGHDVIQANNAEIGISRAAKERPDMILMDIQLPGMDGLSAIKLLRKKEETRDIKIIAITAFAMKGDREKMIGAGSDGYISKPIDYRALLSLIEILSTKGYGSHTGTDSS